MTRRAPSAHAACPTGDHQRHALFRHPPISRLSGVSSCLSSYLRRLLCADMRESRISTVTCGHRAPQVEAKSHQ